MNYKDTLTILIPLWGRERQTKNILSYMDGVKMPFKIILADGGGSDLSSWVNVDSFSNLDLLYINYGRDNNIHDFMVKMNKSCSLITTPLTIMVDNDDFISVNGLINGIKFLNDNPNYSSFRGDIHCLGARTSIYKQPSVTDEIPIDRLKFPKEGLNSGWHDIVRTYTLKKFFDVMDKSETEDLQLVFSINRYWHTLFGLSHKVNNIPFYYHVYGDSLVWNKNIYSTTRTWMVNKNFMDSMSINISMVSLLLHLQNNEDILKIKYRTANIILNHLKELNDYKEDITELIDGVIKNSYNYDELVLEILSKKDDFLTFKLTEEIPNIDLNYNDDIDKIKKFI